MNSNVLVALIGLGGSAIGSLVGILMNSRLVNYRIEQLEKKVDKHNTIVERTYALEERQQVFDERQRVANHRIDDLERITENEVHQTNTK